MAYINGAQTAINITVNGVDLPENVSIPVVVEATLDENGVYNIALDNYTSYKAGDMFFVKCGDNSSVDLSSSPYLYIKINDLEAVKVISTTDNRLFAWAARSFYAYYYESGFRIIEMRTVVEENQAELLVETALADLSNVDNEVFKAKADEAGVGGTSGAMVFKGVVDALPSTANEGEVYKAPYSIVEKGEKIGDYTELYDSAIINDTSVYGYGSGTALTDAMYSVVNNSNTTPVVMMIFDNVNGYEFIINAESTSTEESEYVGTVTYINGSTNQREYTNNSSYCLNDVSLYMGEVKEGYKSYVYHNGEWVEL